MDLMEFVRGAWKILEPSTELQENWHLQVICEYLTLIKDQKFRTEFPGCSEGIIFNVPPRTMKSLLISVFFPAWVWTTKLVALEFDDQLRQVRVGAKIVDDTAWQKCRLGVYTGFSIGGSYVKTWKDGEFTRFTANPVEISVVDNPCVPGAHFTALVWLCPRGNLPRPFQAGRCHLHGWP